MFISLELFVCYNDWDKSYLFLYFFIYAIKVTTMGKNYVYLMKNDQILVWLTPVCSMLASTLIFFCHLFDTFQLLFSCDQAALWMAQSPVCLPVCSHHRIIMKFSGVITNDRSDVHAKGQSQRSKVKVTEVTTQLNGFRNVTPVWVHKWWWNDA